MSDEFPAEPKIGPDRDISFSIRPRPHPEGGLMWTICLDGSIHHMGILTSDVPNVLCVGDYKREIDSLKYALEREDAYRRTLRGRIASLEAEVESWEPAAGDGPLYRSDAAAKAIIEGTQQSLGANKLRELCIAYREMRRRGVEDPDSEGTAD